MGRTRLDSEFTSKEFITLNKEKGIRVDTSVADNHFTAGNTNIMQSIINIYNDSPHRGIKGKTPIKFGNDT
jgi:hypothetical protein